MFDLTDKTVTVIGGQRSGMSMAKLIQRAGGHVKISEQGSPECIGQEFKDWARAHNVEFEFNGHTQAFIEHSDMVVLSPGVRPDAQPVLWAEQKGIVVLGEIEFACQFCPVPIIAVTGSNGKTTVVTLLKEVLSKAGYDVCLCGNIGLPFSEYVLDLEGKDFVVLEVSSFQLESLLDLRSPFRKAGHAEFLIKGFTPFIGVLLNFSGNHLDRHKDIEEYFDAKKKLFLNQSPDDYAVFNCKDARMKALSARVKSRALDYSALNGAGLDSIANPNHLAVVQVSDVLRVDRKVCTDVFEAFKGVEHRLEWVRRLKGVDFINDSKSTTVESGRWALSNIHQPVMMICGGKDKNIDFSAIGAIVKAKVKKMFVIGDARNKLKGAFGSIVSVQECDTLQGAVSQAGTDAQEGDCVVLSPMCASFDMFDNFEVRGREYKRIVNELR